MNKLSSIIIAAAALLIPSTLASADVLFTNGPVNGNVDAFLINFGLSVSDSFTLNSQVSVSGINFGAWTNSGATTSKVDWTISSGVTTFASPTGTTFGSGTGSVTDSFLFNNRYGYDVNKDNFAVSPLTLGPGTYYLTLSNAVASDGSTTYWDDNGGSSMAFDSGLGSLGNINNPGSNSESFDILGTMITASPEPNGLIPVLIGTGMILSMILLKKKSAINN